MVIWIANIKHYLTQNIFFCQDPSKINYNSKIFFQIKNINSLFHFKKFLIWHHSRLIVFFCCLSFRNNKFFSASKFYILTNFSSFLAVGRSPRQLQESFLVCFLIQSPSVFSVMSSFSLLCCLVMFSESSSESSSLKFKGSSDCFLTFSSPLPKMIIKSINVIFVAKIFLQKYVAKIQK